MATRQLKKSREQTPVIESADDVRRRLPFEIGGLDVDNESAFINETLVGYCRDHESELTRCRAYKKNEQAWIEQKNGTVVRRMVGYGRLEGAASAAVLNQLFASARLYVNYFQPSFKLTLLVTRVYQIHSRRVLDEYGWKCSRCGRSRGPADPSS